MSFLEDLGSSLLSSLNEQMGLTDISPTDFNYEQLGAFANKIDKGAHRQYLEDGMIRNVRPRATEVIMQEPDVTILIKKRQFSSLAENFRYDLMNSDEKLFIRASKKLFYNKCRAIAAYERLTKIERITKSNGFISDFALPQIFNAVDTLSALDLNIIDAKTQSILETVRKVKTLSDPNQFTTWIVDRELPYASDVGEGTGVFELTTVSTINCSSSILFGGGGASFTVEDPYKLMIITTEDIERAISEASNRWGQNNFFRLTESGLQDVIGALKNELNSVRTGRGASPIVFKINIDNFVQKKVRAFIDFEGREIIFNFDAGFVGINSNVTLDSSATEGLNGLSSSEAKIFNQIISNIYILIGLQQSTQSEIKDYNGQTKYVRDLMNLNFAGKSIIQPMDNLHVFISTKTQTDSKITQGLNINFSSSSLLNKINDTLGNIEAAFEDIKSTFTGGENSYLETEKNAIAGQEFPMWLWTMMRNDFTRQAAGTHVFAGVIESANQNYSGGKYTLSVNAKDNTTYFSTSQININPSVDVFNSSIYDPLTPFKLDFDASSGFLKGEFPPLLDENISLLHTGSVKAKQGRFRGFLLTEEVYSIQDAEPMTPTRFRRKLNDADGFVYRWKRGIGSLTLFGEPHASPNFRSESSPSLTKDPFSGQDTMNALSLLITGQPYNYNTFLRAAIESGNLSRDDLMNRDGSSSFFRGFINDLSKQNATWGNFIPFKKLVINEKGTHFLASGEFDLTTSNKRASELLKERAKRFDVLTGLMPEFANSPQFYKVGVGGAVNSDPNAGEKFDKRSLSKLAQDIIEIDFEIAKLNKDFQNSIEKASTRSGAGSFKIFGDDISFDPSVDSNSGVTHNEIVAQRNEFRKKLNNLTQRRLWRVKANEDSNLFIVDDSYDKNYDIQTFERTLSSGLELFKSTFTKIGEKIQSVAAMLGLEIFADSQGHIQARAPQYNRMPSSVFHKMIQEKKKKNIQLFPDFLESLFFNQIQGLVQEIEIIEDEIRIRAAALGAITDDDAKKLLKGGAEIGKANFAFVTGSDGKFGGSADIRLFIEQSYPDISESKASKPLTEISSKLSPVLESTNNFDIIQRITIANSEKSFTSINDKVTEYIKEIAARLAQKKDGPAPTQESLISNNRTLGGRSQVDIIKITEEISVFIKDRQYLIKLLANATKNLDQGISLDEDPNGAANALFPAFNKPSDKNVFPEILEHMIEDEDHDDLGVGSGKRYILTDSKIIDLTISEKPPEWTVVEVNGQLENALVPRPDGLTISDSGGNAIATAIAADYDMWRMYGFKTTNSVNVPFLSHPEAQCAPYAVNLLNQARANIFQATITVVGNEFIQPGEVYYIEDRNLLFYAETISHSFSYGGQYTTNITAKYGHTPGTYIPTMLDVLGKALYSKGHQANLVRHERFGTANNETPITVITHENEGLFSTTPVADLVSSKYGEQNKKNLSNALLAVGGLLTPTDKGKRLKLQIRTYHNSAMNVTEDNSLKSIAEGILDWIKTPSGTKESFNTGGAKDLIPDNNIRSIPAENVEVVAIDLGEDGETRSPSGPAWRMAQTLALTGNSLAINDIISSETNTSQLNPSKLANQQLFMLNTKIIDIWIVFSDAETESVSTPKDVNDENSLDKKEQYIEAFNKRIGLS